MGLDLTHYIYQTRSRWDIWSGAKKHTTLQQIWYEKSKFWQDLLQDLLHYLASRLLLQQVVYDLEQFFPKILYFLKNTYAKKLGPPQNLIIRIENLIHKNKKLWKNLGFPRTQAKILRPKNLASWHVKKILNLSTSISKI